MNPFQLYCLYHLIFGFLLVGVYASIKHRIQESLSIKNVLTVLLFWPILLLIVMGVLLAEEFGEKK